MIESSKKIVSVHCPVCSKKGKIKIDELIIEQSPSGIMTVNVAQKSICNHSFIAYIDRNLSIRDCFACDFTITLPEIEIGDLSKSTGDVDFDIDIIKFNLIPSLLTNVLKGIIHGKQIVILDEIDYMNQKFIDFFNYIFEESFNHDIRFLRSSDYKKSKREYKKHLVLKGSEVLNNINKIHDSKKIKVENSIIQSFFSERDSVSGLIILKNEIMKLYRLSQDMIDYYNSLEKSEAFTSKRAIDYLNKKYSSKISFPYLTLLEEIISNYFKINLKKAPGLADMVDFL